MWCRPATAYHRLVQIRIRFHPDGRALDVEPGTSLLEAARRAGLPMASACGAHGICGRCGVYVEAGGEELPAEADDERAIKARNRVNPHQRLACRVHPTRDVEVRASYW